MKIVRDKHIPLVSIAMPMYNGQSYLREAIDSILNQTYTNIELIVIDDGSTDNSVSIIESYDDPRISLFQNDKNRGVAYTRNRAIELAKGDYLAWMDCDDISLPKKIDLQVAFMEKNLDVSVCGTSYLRFFEKEIFYQDIAESNHEKIRTSFIFRPATIFMPTAMLRTTVLAEDKIQFDDTLRMAEDYDFFQRFCEVRKSSNLTEVLFHYRDNPESITNTYEKKKHERFLLKQKIYKRILEDISVTVVPEDLINHENCTNSIMFKDFKTFKNCASHLRIIEEANNASKKYDAKLLKKILQEQFFFISKKAGGLGLKTLFFYIRKSITWGYFNGFTPLAKVSVRSIMRYSDYNLKNRIHRKKIA